MTDTQLYFSIGVPTFAILIGILVNMMQLSTVTSTMNARFASLETRISNLESRFDLLLGKVIEIDNRLTRVEERLEHLR